MNYAEVVLPVPIGDYYTYAVPPELSGKVQVGMRVLVPFGRKKHYTGVVSGISDVKPEGYEVKEIYSLLDKIPVFDAVHISFLKWISSYYMSSPGNVLKAALPGGLRMESQTKVYLNDEYADAENIPVNLSVNERKIIDLLKNSKGVSVKDINEATGISNSLRNVNEMLEKGIVKVEESLKTGYKEKREKYICLAENFSEEEVSNYLDKLSKAPKQQQLLLLYLNLSKQFVNNSPENVNKSELLKNFKGSNSALKALTDKKILKEYTLSVSRLEKYEGEIKQLNTLNSYQEKSLQEIRRQFEHKDCVLLHGVTSSGKTEIYIHLIEEYIKAGKQVLYLLPEIALTSQIIRRLRSFFGDEAGVYHSKYSDRERVEVWKNLQNGNDENSFKIILGVRSSLFLPFKNLGLIIVDEEHETTYKQYEPAPRYHARDAALVLAKKYGAKTLLGSATPSVESYYNAKNDKYGMSVLKNRYCDITMPEIIVADMYEARRKKIMKGIFTPELYEGIKSTLQKGKQVILFQNRRGYAPLLFCEDCGSISKCKNCDVSLTYHRYNNKLVCHYCGYEEQVPRICPVCSGENMSVKGYGTEKIEEELQKYFPKARVARLDQDSVKTKKSMNAVISDFESGETDILVGTQMVSKGLDFENVEVVGVMNADAMMNFPDFRAYERSFQMMVQVAGRAGRHGSRGRVIVQTMKKDHSVIRDLVNNDYEGMFAAQMAERKEFIYPPYYKMIEIDMKCRNKNIILSFSYELARRLRTVFGIRVYGPQEPLIARVYNNYAMKIILKIEPGRSLSRAKALLKKEADELLSNKKYKSVTLWYDVDCL